MTEFLAAWLTVVVVAGLAMISPGPNYAVTLKHSLLYSRRVGLWTAVGVAAGNLLHVTLSLLGLAVIVAQSVLLFNVLKWIGVAYLVYLGIVSLMARKKGAEESPGVRGAAGQIGLLRAVRTSFLVSVLNPKVTLFYLVLFTQVIDPGTSLETRILFGMTAVVLSFGWYALVAFFVSHEAIKNRFHAAAHWVERVTGAMLIALGVKLAFSRMGD